MKATAKPGSKRKPEASEYAGNMIHGDIWIKLGFTPAQHRALKRISKSFTATKDRTTAMAARRVIMAGLAHWDMLEPLDLEDRKDVATSFAGWECKLEKILIQREGNRTKKPTAPQDNRQSASLSFNIDSEHVNWLNWFNKRNFGANASIQHVAKVLLHMALIHNKEVAGWLDNYVRWREAEGFAGDWPLIDDMLKIKWKQEFGLKKGVGHDA